MTDPSDVEALLEEAANFTYAYMTGGLKPKLRDAVDIMAKLAAALRLERDDNAQLRGQVNSATIHLEECGRFMRAQEAEVARLTKERDEMEGWQDAAEAALADEVAKTKRLTAQVQQARTALEEISEREWQHSTHPIDRSLVPQANYTRVVNVARKALAALAPAPEGK